MNQVFDADYALTATDNFSPISTAPAKRAAQVPGVQVVSGVRAGAGPRVRQADQRDRRRARHQPGDHGRLEGRARRLCPASSKRDGAFVSKDFASAHHLDVGSPHHGRDADRHGDAPGSARHLRAAEGRLSVSATSRSRPRRFDAEYQNPQNVFTFINIAGGVTAANRRRLERRGGELPERQGPDRAAVQATTRSRGSTRCSTSSTCCSRSRSSSACSGS